MTEADDLAAAERAFERGDFRAVRAITGRLGKSLDADLRKRALALRARVSVDPAALVVWVLCLLFLLGVAVRYLGGR